MFNNSDNGTNSGSIYSKFRERLRKIKLSRSKKKKQNDLFVKEKVIEIREELRKEPSKHFPSRKVPDDTDNNLNSQISTIKKEKNIDTVLKDIKLTKSDRDYSTKRVGIFTEVVPSNHKVKNESLIDIGASVNVKKLKKDDTRLDELVKDVKANKPKVYKGKRVGYVSYDKEDMTNVPLGVKKEILRDKATDIIEKLKDNFEEKLDELEVLESELFLINEKNKSELELKKVKELKLRIEETIEKINLIIDQYNLYKRNYYIDNVIGIDDNVILDDILDYRSTLDSFEDEKSFVKEYKALDEFKSLYDNLVHIKDEVDKLQVENIEKIEEFDVRDKKYDNIKLGLINFEDIDKKCSREIDKQNEQLKEIMSKVSDITSEEYITTHLRGMGALLSSSLRYMGMILMSPFTGMVPGISMQTIMMRRMVGNAYRNLHFENITRVHYDAVNYESELNHYLTDVKYAECLIYDTLKDVSRLREDFMMIYNSNIPGYDDTLKKINAIEKKLIRNQNKISIVKKNLKQSKKLNEKKIIKVRELNEKEQRRAA